MKNKTDEGKRMEGNLTKGPILKTLTKLAIPIMASSFLGTLYNITDMAWIGLLGSKAVAGVGVGGMFTWLSQGLAAMARMGGQVQVAQCIGRDERDRAHGFAQAAVQLATLMGMAYAVISLVFTRQMVAFFQLTDPEAQTAALSYTKIACGLIVFSFLTLTMTGLYTAQGDSKTPFLANLIGLVTNMILDPVLILGPGPFPKLGVVGAAIATVTAQALSVVFAVVLLIKKELPFTIKKSDFRLNPQCKRFLQIGLPLALQEFLTQLSFLALCAFVNRLGLEASSGYGVACKIVNFAMLVPSSLMQSMASFVSQNVGAGKTKRAKQSMFTGIGVGLAVGCLVFVLVMFKGDVVAGIFSTDASVIQNAFAYLKGFAPETIVTAILFSMVGYFNGNNKTVWVMIQGLVQTLLVRLPLAYYMSIQPNASLTRIGLAAPVATVTGIILNVGFFVYLNRAKKTATSPSS